MPPGQYDDNDTSEYCEGIMKPGSEGNHAVSAEAHHFHGCSHMQTHILTGFGVFIRRKVCKTENQQRTNYRRKIVGCKADPQIMPPQEIQGHRFTANIGSEFPRVRLVIKDLLFQSHSNAHSAWRNTQARTPASSLADAMASGMDGAGISRSSFRMTSVVALRLASSKPWPCVIASVGQASTQ
jgi:hypothetical protein